MGRNETKINILCNKNTLPKEGTLQVFINEVKLTKSNCLEYYPGSPNDYFCLSKSFTFDTTTNFETNNAYFNITCTIEENTNVLVNAKLYKLCKY